MWGASQMPRGTRSLYLCRGWHGIITRLASLPRMGQCYYSTYKADCQDLCEKLPLPFPSDRGLHVRFAITWRRAPTKHKFCATRRAKFSFCIIAFTSKKLPFSSTPSLLYHTPPFRSRSLRIVGNIYIPSGGGFTASLCTARRCAPSLCPLAARALLTLHYSTRSRATRAATPPLTFARCG